MCKASDSIDNSSISHLGYTYTGRGWVEKGLSAPAPLEIDTDEEASLLILCTILTVVHPLYLHFILLVLDLPQLHQIGTNISLSVLTTSHLICMLSLRNMIAALEFLCLSRLRFFLFCNPSFLLLHRSRCAPLYVL